MAASANPDVWALLFAQTPLALRWLLGGLIVGLGALAGWLWKLQNRDIKRVEYQQKREVERVEQQLHSRIKRETDDINDRLTRENHEIREKLEVMNGHLINISQNTQRIVNRSEDEEEG